MVVLWTKKEEDSLQFSSSELSPQSFWLSHLQWSGMQLLFSQRNSWGPQVFSSFSSTTNKHTEENGFKSAWILMCHYSTSTCNHHFLRVSQTHVWHRVQNIPKLRRRTRHAQWNTWMCNYSLFPQTLPQSSIPATCCYILSHLSSASSNKLNEKLLSVQLSMSGLHTMNQSQGRCLRQKKLYQHCRLSMPGYVCRSKQEPPFLFFSFFSLLHFHWITINVLLDENVD